MEPYTGVAGSQPWHSMHWRCMDQIATAYEAHGGDAVACYGFDWDIGRLHAAPPIALGVGIIDLVSAALTVWALVAERERRIAPPR